MRTAATNTFSFSRLDQVWSFYAPCTTRYLMWAAIATVVSYLMYLLADKTDVIGMMSISGTLLGAFAYMAPTAFTFVRNRSLVCQLPATAAEQFTFMLLFSYVAVPLTMAAIWLSLEGISGLCGYDNSMFATMQRLYASELDAAHMGIFNDFYNLLMKRTRWLQYLSWAMSTAVVLLIVIATEKQRFMKAVAGVIVAGVAVGIVSGVFMIVRMVDFFSSAEFARASEEDIMPVITNVLMNGVNDIANFSLCVVPAIIIICLYLSWRKFKSFQM